ncbi:MAG: hypothetical protein KDC05_06970 [Bacteroidales bacterium]|nr:hypothetical protein [Bacteroidales bacterium]
MKKHYSKLLVPALFILLIYMAGCVSTEIPGNYNVDPEVLEATGGTVNFKVTGTVPEKSFHKKAKVEFTPYVKYDGKTKELDKFTLRGEKTEGDGTVINSKTGGSFTYTQSFEYTDEMKDAELFVSPKIIKGSKEQTFDDIKIADGIIVTYQNVLHDEKTIQAPSGYEKETIISEMATIYFRQNMHNLNWSMELNQDAKEKREQLDEFLMNGWEIKDIKIDAWASPEGELSFNENLAEDRSETAKKYMEDRLKTTDRKLAKEKGVKESEIERTPKYNASSHGEDWDGFMKAVKNSDIKDKSTIINVVNSQSDVAKREQEIRNMTVIYNEVADEILPPLRRAEITVNCFEPKRSDEEIAELAATSPDSLTYKELLHAADLTDDNQAKYNIYKAGFTHPDRDWKTYNNAAVEALALGKMDEAENYLNQANKLAPGNGIIENNLGVLSSRKENYQDAEMHFMNAQKAGEDVSYNLGIIAIQKGEYQKALTQFKNIDCDHNVALAQLLSGKMNEAFNNLKCAPESPKTFYMLAVYGARTNNADLVYEYLGKAVAKDSSMKAKAKDDKEFVKFADNDQFKNIVN